MKILSDRYNVRELDGSLIGSEANTNAGVLLYSLLKNRRIREYIWSVLTLLIVGISIVMLQWRFPDDGFIVGEASPQSYLARRTMIDEDPTTTTRLRDIVGNRVLEVNVRTNVSQEREKLRRSLVDLYPYTWADLFKQDEFGESAAVRTHSNVNDGLHNVIDKMDEARRTHILTLAVQVGDALIEELDSIEERGEGPVSESDKSILLWAHIERLVPANDANLVYQILKEYSDIDSKRTDPDLTDRLRQSIIGNVKNVVQVINEGDILIEEGQIITPQKARILRSQGYLEEGFPSLQIMLVLLMSLVLPLCLDIPGRKPLKWRPSWSCIVFVIIITWCCEAIGVGIDNGASGVGILPGVMTAFLCMPGASAFSVSFAASISSVLLLMRPLPASDVLALLILSVLISVVGFYSLQYLSTRSELRRRVFFMAILTQFARTAILWIQGFPVPLSALSLFNPVGSYWLNSGGFIVLTCALSTAAAFALTFVENYIGVISLFTLRDLSATMTPLLQLLQKNAPGTYQHCLTMATLAEAVAMAIGLDANLMRVGAYYHDIGKLRRPRFFVENQGGGFNPHDEMSPALSAITIISHVRDGLELAKEYKLPTRIRDFIAEHHGTTCARYFYNKAVASGEKVQWEDFCYPGPKPQSRETALLMIVDSLEAAVRSLGLDKELINQKKRAADGSIPHPNDGRSKAIVLLEERIKQVINSKVHEGQFENVDFTLQEMNKVKDALVDAILSMYHTRTVKKIERKSTGRA